MNSQCLLIILSFSSVLISMEKPPKKQGTAGLSASAGQYAQAARKLRERMEQEQNSGFFADAENFINNLFSRPANKNVKSSEEVQSEEAQIDKEIEKMNTIFARWKINPLDSNLRMELVSIQQHVMGMQVQLLENKPKLSLKVGNAVAQVSKERDEILRKGGHQFKSQSSRLPQVKLEMRITQNDIKNALTHLTEKRNKSRMTYVWGARIGLAGVLAGLGYAAYSKSVQPVAVAGGFATLFGISAFAQTKFPKPTQADAKSFLELQNK